MEKEGRRGANGACSKPKVERTETLLQRAFIIQTRVKEYVCLHSFKVTMPHFFFFICTPSLLSPGTTLGPRTPLVFFLRLLCLLWSFHPALPGSILLSVYKERSSSPIFFVRYLLHQPLVRPYLLSFPSPALVVCPFRSPPTRSYRFIHGSSTPLSSSSLPFSVSHRPLHSSYLIPKHLKLTLLPLPFPLNKSIHHV